MVHLKAAAAAGFFSWRRWPHRPRSRTPGWPPCHGWSPKPISPICRTTRRSRRPFLVKFGLSGGWGLAPISKPLGGKSGHHHLLINRDLPLDFKQALPFNDQYIHFGKGQMEAVLTLAPGSYNLRLLLADAQHLPHFVYSKPLKLTVTKNNAAVVPASLTKKGIELLNLADGARFKPPFRLQFHASGLNVAHLEQKEADTGHFRLVLMPQKGPPAEMDFINGQTEAWLQPPPGSYTVKLDFLDNANPGKVLPGR